MALQRVLPSSRMNVGMTSLRLLCTSPIKFHNLSQTRYCCKRRYPSCTTQKIPELDELYSCKVKNGWENYDRMINNTMIVMHGLYRFNYLRNRGIHSLLSARPYSQQHNELYVVSNNLNRSVRCIYSMKQVISDSAQHWEFWGASGILLKSLHHEGLIPFGACMSLVNVIARTSMIPLVLKGAHTSARLANVAPEVQFLITLFQHDFKVLKKQRSSTAEKISLFRITWKSLKKIYKLHNINPLAVLKSPLMQIPVFWYISVDIRKIINGGDPSLAQQLTESTFFWVTNLTEPDPYYGLPVISGLLLYMNVEMAVGKNSLSGETASKSNVAKILKDTFQSLALFMPCFMSHSPSGVQIYLSTSFIFTMMQGIALRDDSFRKVVGLPSMDSQVPEPKLAKEFLELRALEKQALEQRGSSELLGSGVLAPGWETSFGGRRRQSTIDINPKEVTPMLSLPKKLNIWVGQGQKNIGPFPPQELSLKVENLNEEMSNISKVSNDLMESANNGVDPSHLIRFVPEHEKSLNKVKLNIKRRVAKKKTVSYTKQQT